jgi:dTDP-glucose pyrophosphorylase
MMIKTFIQENATIADAVSDLNKSHSKIVLILSADRKLLGTISDGDIRRGLLKGLGLNSPITGIVNRDVLVVPPNMDHQMVMQLMVANKVQQIPIVDDNHNVLGLHLWDEIVLPLTPALRPNLMVIMAGGEGMRLRPHTENCPKPMLHVSGKPMLEHIIEKAKSEGFSNFVLSVHYLGHIIEDYFGNGERLGVKIDYLREETPLGTAGALGLLKRVPDVPFVVTNGDVMTDIRYGELLDFHARYDAKATMAVRVHEWQNPFGVVQIKDLDIIGFKEKPITRTHINAGVYALSPDVLDELIDATHCDMPTLFERLQAKAKRTVAYPMHEPWMDVGRPEELIAANAKVDQL